MTSSTDYKALTREISSNVSELRNSVPQVMQGFNALGKAALAGGAIDAKTKELIALGIGVAARCDGYIGFHTQALARLGATRAEVHEVLGIAVYMGGGPALMYAANAVAAFDECAPAQAPAATA
ncbi:carboxymuconolactone decarboxylase family protein [Diaphorobacter sp. MNS-0]|uniref:carboxymuconolactone decarboxylase family protein n=1 Tax=Diaphorobacter sp. MNS-0 TaxID=2866628 RepID=UPI001C73639C|nr:carboxymuconolactone decarboxylase family protein [Diaphorobacter sp. MNS-0]QYY24921.1 carboxymuconolactone decarboxylase family protein [Diaphorobacter sp. MNS-0]